MFNYKEYIFMDKGAELIFVEVYMYPSLGKYKLRSYSDVSEYNIVHRGNIICENYDILFMKPFINLALIDLSSFRHDL